MDFFLLFWHWQVASRGLAGSTFSNYEVGNFSRSFLEVGQGQLPPSYFLLFPASAYERERERGHGDYQGCKEGSVVFPCFYLMSKVMGKACTTPRKLSVVLKGSVGLVYSGT